MAGLLTLSFQDLLREVKEYAIGGTGFPSTDSDEEALCTGIIDSGLRQFYSPPPIGGRVHEWSFLKPVTNTKLNAPYSNGNTNTASYVDSTNIATVTKLTITAITTADPAEVTTASAHGFETGDKVNVSGFTAPVNGVRTITKTSGTQFTIGVDGAGQAVGGGDDECYKKVPDWATSGFLDLDGVSYPIVSQLENTVTLDSDDNPGADVTSKTFKIHQDDYDLPEDFSRIVGNITFSEKDNSWHTVRIVGEARIRELRQRDYAANSSTGPVMAAILPKKTGVTAAATQTSGTATHTLQFWPAVTQSAVIHYRYEVRPPKLSAAADYPYGADDHSDTILYSCLSEAERKVDREVGVYKMRFMEALASSIEKDGRANRPELLGYNSDQSDGFDPEHTRIFGGRIRHKQQDGSFLE